MEDYDFEATELPAFNYNKAHEEPDDEYVGGIHTRFYDESGTQVYEIPAIIHKVFNEEYGIRLKYNEEHEMLYYAGSCEPAYEKTSPLAIGYWKKELSRFQVSKGKLEIGYKLGYKLVSETKSELKGFDRFDDDGYPLSIDAGEDIVTWGVVPSINTIKDKENLSRYRERGGIPLVLIVPSYIALIDLNEFNEDLSLKAAIPKLDIGLEVVYNYHIKEQKFKVDFPVFPHRLINLARVLEHEFIGHALLKFTDDSFDLKDRVNDSKKLSPSPVEAYIGNPIRRELHLPDRTDDPLKNPKKGTYSDDDIVTEFEFGYLGKDHEESLYPEIDFFRIPKWPEKMWSIGFKIKDVKETFSVIGKYINVKYNYDEKTLDLD